MVTFDELAAAQAGRVVPTSTPLDVEFGGQSVSLVFSEIDGKKWADIVARHPIRPDAPLDLNVGYNHTTASLEAAIESGTATAGDDVLEMSAENWATLLASLDGNATRRLVDTIWTLNEWNPSQRIAALKKASKPAGPSRRKRS